MPELMTNLDFTAVKVGDVSGNADANTLTTAETRSKGDFTLRIDNQNLHKGDTFTVPIYPENMQGIAGYQFTLAFQNLELITLDEGIAKANNFGMHLTDRGYITTSWNSPAQSSTLSQQTMAESLFQLTFKAKKDGQLKDFLSINSDITSSEAYTNNGELLAINLTMVISEEGDFSLLQNTPNPFKEITKIDFHIPKTSTVQFKILNTQGMILHQQAIEAHQGNNSFSYKQYLPPGTYFYQLATPFGTQTKKMIVLKSFYDAKRH